MRRGRGRPRKRQGVVPSHIDAAKLPNYCYWDAEGNHWYTIYKVDGKPKRTKIADEKATLADLHKIMEQRAGLDTDNLIWLGKKFEESIQFKQISPASQKDWEYCARVIAATPSKVPGITAGQVPLGYWAEPSIQKLIDQIAETNGPSAAKHCAAYLKRVYNWSVTRGHVKRSPVGKLELPKERKRRRLPTRETMAKLVTLAQERGGRPAHTKGSCPPYIWKSLVIAYRCRFRGIEVFSLSDASLLEEGIQSARRKGSNDNITRWHPDLRIVVDAAQARRSKLWSARKRPVPLRPEDRQLIVGEKGERVTSSAWQNAWRDFLAMAIAEKVITEEQRFGLHDLKRRGITDTKGGKAAKLEGGGHKDPAMLDIYDFELPIVDAAGE